MAQEDRFPPPPDRRGFLKKTGAILIGAIAGLFPLATGLTVFFDPLWRRQTKSSDFVQVASLKGLPEDGLPRKFSVVTSRVDTWTKAPQTPVGAVYLRRTGPSIVQAFNVVCPHAGCFVDFKPELKGYKCPCHDSTFALDGKISSAKSPAPRGLDELEVEIRNENEVWVKFQNFRAGDAKKIPLA